jgi:uncharacterized membrane protein
MPSCCRTQLCGIKKWFVYLSPIILYINNMKKFRIIINILIIVLIAFQAIGYIGSWDKVPTNLHGINNIAYFIGYNFFLLFALILFFVSIQLKRKIRKKEMLRTIDSIGKE